MHVHKMKFTEKIHTDPCNTTDIPTYLFIITIAIALHSSCGGGWNGVIVVFVLPQLSGNLFVAQCKGKMRR